MSKLAAHVAASPRLGPLFGLLSLASFLAFLYNINKPPQYHKPHRVTNKSLFKMHPAARQAAVESLCPHSTFEEHVPTIILRGDGQRDPREDRTHFVLDSDGTSSVSLAPRTQDRLRFDQTLSAMPYGADAVRGAQLCEVHPVPSSPPASIPRDWNDNKIIFGMSTKPERIMFNLPVWSHWMPRAPHPIDGSPHSTKDLPLLIVLTPPPETTQNYTKMMEAQNDGLTRGIHIEVRPRVSDRFETRYFALAEEMWQAGLRRERDEGIRVEWFIFADDDTFFHDWSLLVRMLSKYDPNSPLLVGALSEIIGSIAVCGVMAYGGAGIYVSWALLEAINAPGVWADCLDEFGDLFGGDNMISRCAAYATGQNHDDLRDTLVLEDSLHQLDIMGDGSGWFQSGFHITSMHHWATWFKLFPDWHGGLISSVDVRGGIMLVGEAAKAVGGDNWLRRFVFDGGRTVVTLGYSVVVYDDPLNYSDLGKSEHTWWQFDSYWPLRMKLFEELDKTSYYIVSASEMSAGVWKLSHKSNNGERVDVIWDGRSRSIVTKIRDRTGW